MLRFLLNLYRPFKVLNSEVVWTENIYGLENRQAFFIIEILEFHVFEYCLRSKMVLIDNCIVKQEPGELLARSHRISREGNIQLGFVLEKNLLRVKLHTHYWILFVLNNSYYLGIVEIIITNDIKVFVQTGD